MSTSTSPASSTDFAELPPTVRRYLEMRESAEPSQVVELFAPDAVVSDEGRTHHGRDEIRAWIEETNAAYEYTTEFLGARETDGTIGVSFRLTGDFPGGVVELEYQFRMDDEGRIAHLFFA